MTFKEYARATGLTLAAAPFAEEIWQAAQAAEHERAKDLVDALQAILKTGDKLSKVVAQYAIDKYEGEK
jgi:hypothetical protein